MKVSSINVNNFNKKYISFGEGNMNNIAPSVAILALQAPNAKINFENDMNRSKRADMVQNPNFISAFVNKITKAVNEFRRNDSNVNIHPDIYNHISYTA